MVSLRSVVMYSVVDLTFSWVVTSLVLSPHVCTLVAYPGSLSAFAAPIIVKIITAMITSAIPHPEPSAPELFSSCNAVSLPPPFCKTMFYVVSAANIFLQQYTLLFSCIS